MQDIEKKSEFDEAVVDKKTGNKMENKFMVRKKLRKYYPFRRKYNFEEFNKNKENF